MKATKYLLAGMLCLLSGLGWSQNTTGLSDNQAARRASFAQIQSNQMYRGALLNRNLSVHETIFTTNGTPQAQRATIVDWMKMFQDLWLASSDQDLQTLPSVAMLEARLGNFLQNYPSTNGVLQVPVGMLDFKSTNIHRQAFDNGRIRMRNGVFVDRGLRPQDFQAVEVVSMVPFLQELPGTTVTYVFHPDFWFTNHNDAPTDVSVDFGDGNGFQKVNMGDKVTITYAPTQSVTFESKIEYQSGAKKSGIAALLPLSDPNLPKDEVDFDEGFTVTIANGASMDVGVIYSDCNQGLVKPLIVAHGFLSPGAASALRIIGNDAGSDGGGLATADDVTLSSLYHKFNYSGQMESYLDAGQDLVIFRLNNRYTAIQNYGLLVAEAIKVVNARKATFNSHFENSAIGFSLGAMALRYALNQMEVDLMNGVSNEHHHTRINTSYDGGHLGNNLPLGIQAGLIYAVAEEGENGWLLKIMYYLLNTDMAKSASIYHFSKQFDETSTYQTPHPLRENLANTLVSQTHSGTIVNGYPAFSRNVAVSQGDRRGVADPPYSFGDWGDFYDKYAWASADVRASATDKSSSFFKFSAPLSVADEYFTNSSSLEADNAPGSYEYGLYSNSMMAIRNAYATFSKDAHIEWYVDNVDPNCDRSTGGPWCFVPVVSAYALNTSKLGIDDDWEYNLDAGGLMFDAPGSMNPGYGYPAVGHPTDHFRRTPFEALCGVSENSHHIAGFRAEFEPSEPDICEFRFGSLNLQLRARDFMAGEMVPDELRLQNKIIGANTRSDLEYRAHYEAVSNIEFGREVTWSTDRLEYAVEDNGHIESRASNYIGLEAGFSVEAGGFFLAEIEPITCGYIRPDDPSWYSGRKYVAGAPTTFESDVIEATPLPTEGPSMNLFPNPNQGRFTLQLDGLKSAAQVVVYDLQGREVLRTQVQKTQQEINLSDQEQGTYIIQVVTDNWSEAQRIVVQ